MAAPCAPWHGVRGPVRNGDRARPFNTIVRKHMDHLESPAMRAIIGVIIGFPGSALGSLALFQATFGGLGIPLAIWDAMSGHLRADYVANQFALSFVWFVWGVCGVAGMAGFWLWVLSPRPLSERKRRWLIGLMSVGVAAAIPVAIIYPGVPAVLAAVGVVAGVVLVVNMCFLTNRRSGP